jgi:hypothetical protein
MVDSGERLIWRYEVKPEAVAAFEAAYGTGGDWDQFFAGAPGYARTELYRDVESRYVYLTIDYWSKPGQRDAYVASRRAEYDSIDARCAEFTLDERAI